MRITKDPYTEAQERGFLVWIRTLRSCLSGRSPCIAAHVRSVAQGAGTSRKPRLYAVPLTDAEHQTQSNQGYLEAIKKHGTKVNLAIWSGDIDNEKIGLNWFKDAALRYRDKFLQLEVK